MAVMAWGAVSSAAAPVAYKDRVNGSVWVGDANSLVPDSAATADAVGRSADGS
eukprot:gene12381-15870_t